MKKLFIVISIFIVLILCACKSFHLGAEKVDVSVEKCYVDS